jgi:hypothetical protein
VKFVELPLSLTRAINAELLKLKRTLAFRVIFVLPFLVALLEFFIVLRTKKFPATFNLWQTLTTNSLQVCHLHDATVDCPGDCAAQRHRAHR